MRKIEKQIINYLKKLDFKKSDFKKSDFGKFQKLGRHDFIEVWENYKKVYLWDSCIFSINKENLIKFSLQGWNTATTKSRINAYLQEFSFCFARIYQKNNQLFFSSSVGVFPIDFDTSYAIRQGIPQAIENML